MEPAENPYAAPLAPIARPRLPPLWRTALAGYLRQHAEGASYGLLLRMYWKQLLFGAIYFLATGGLALAAGFSSAGWFWLGVWAGSLLHTLAQFRAYLKLWPLLDRIFDWDRVRRLLDERDDAGRTDA